MDKFVIIKIEDNHLNQDGHSLIVKANHIENAPGFGYLSEMFGNKYYTYSLDETSDTEMASETEKETETKEKRA